MYVLFDYGATHSFVTNKLVGKLGKNPCRAKKRFTISTTLGTNININHVFKGIRIDINGYEMRVYLIPFELHDFDVILGMEWLCMMIGLCYSRNGMVVYDDRPMISVLSVEG